MNQPAVEGNKTQVYAYFYLPSLFSLCGGPEGVGKRNESSTVITGL